MIPDLSDIFARYEALRAEADAIFGKVKHDLPQCVVCKEGCSDCCHALFDLSLVEAMYLNKLFVDTYPYGQQRSDILERAMESDRRLTRLKRDMYRATRDGRKTPEEVMAEVARLRMRCPLLGDDDRCLFYEQRPITCRLYGVPTAILGKGHVCGHSGFEKGKQYPTVHLDKIQERLHSLSTEIKERCGSRFKELDEVYIPLSMTLLTRYDEAYLGIGPAKRED
ncbi:MAG: YkgJ family cysteine cluster protein [Desulfovibrionaceae bacterium]|nr:YkgJ family cysteine cluster protein [Desulfovibrionaceae bacterium]